MGPYGDMGTSETDRRTFLKTTAALAVAYLLPRAVDADAMNAEPEQNPAAINASAFAAGGKTSGSKRIEPGPVQIEYFECGNPEGVPLVLVHGFPDSPLAWEAVVSTPDLDRHRVVLPYLRG